MAILDSENWQSALKNCTVEGNKILTPMRKLIKKLPGKLSVYTNLCASHLSTHNGNYTCMKKCISGRTFI